MDPRPAPSVGTSLPVKDAVDDLTYQSVLGDVAGTMERPRFPTASSEGWRPRSTVAIAPLTPVRNVAHPVIRRPFAFIDL